VNPGNWAQNPQTESRIEMSDKPVFIYAATYSNPTDAEADYEGLLELHAAKASREATPRNWAT
jgi:hypothetical protein